MRSMLLACLGFSLMSGLNGCGTDAASSESTAAIADTSLTIADTSAPEETAAADTTVAAPTAAPSLDRVLACMTSKGLDAKDQSSSTGDTIGIDYPGGRLVVSFEETEEEAKTYASVSESFGETIRKGTVVISLPDDPGAAQAKSTVEECVDAG